MEFNQSEKSDPVYKLLRQVKRLCKGKSISEKYLTKLRDIPKIMKTCGSAKRKMLIGAISYILFSRKNLKGHLYNSKLISKKNDVICFNSTEANLEQFRMNNQHYKTERRSSKLYYTEISSFPHGNLKLIDCSDITEMASELDFKDFPDPNFYYIWTYEQQKIQVKTKNEYGDDEEISISLESISDEGQWRKKKLPMKQTIAEVEAREKDTFFDQKLYKMSIFDKIEYLKNTGKINYEDYTIKSAIALNSKRFQAYRYMKDNKMTSKTTAAKSRAYSHYRRNKNNGRVIDFSSKMSNSFNKNDYFSPSRKTPKEKKRMVPMKKNIFSPVGKKKELDRKPAEVINYNVMLVNKIKNNLIKAGGKRRVKSNKESPKKVRRKNFNSVDKRPHSRFSRSRNVKGSFTVKARKKAPVRKIKSRRRVDKEKALDDDCTKNRSFFLKKKKNKKKKILVSKDHKLERSFKARKTIKVLQVSKKEGEGGHRRKRLLPGLSRKVP